MAQIGTAKVQTENNGVVELPVFDLGDSGSEMYEIVRVDTDGGVGFIPTAGLDIATEDYLRIQTENNGTLGFDREANILIDDFEDGDFTITQAAQDRGWSGWQGSGDAGVTINSSGLIDGTYSAKLNIGAGESESIGITHSSSVTHDIQVKVYNHNDTADDTAGVDIDVNEPNGNTLMQVVFDDDDGNNEEDVFVVDGNGAQNIGAWDSGVIYTVTFEPDFPNDQYTATVSGVGSHTANFEDNVSASDWGEMFLACVAGDSENREVDFDTIRVP